MTINSEGQIGRKALSKVRQSLAEESLYAFVKQAWHVVEPSTPFVDGWHLRAICDHLEACTKGDIRKLIINIPPRHMKSLAVGVFWFCWSWIHHPSSRWIFCSYSHFLSTRDSLKARAVLESDWYQSLWGDRITLRTDANTMGRFENNARGFRMATGVGGSATGEGGDFIIADDPHKASDVFSDTQRNGVLRWWDNTMSTRLNDPKTGRFVVVMQRLHERDLAGWIMEQGRGYDVLCIPAEYDPEHPYQQTTSIGWSDPRDEPGEVVWPERYGRDQVDELKSQLGSAYNVSGQLQQNPAPQEGGMFDRKQFQYFVSEDVEAGDSETTKAAFIFRDSESGKERVIWKSDCWCFQTCDTAMKTKEESNYTVVMTVYITPGGDVLIYDVARDKIPVPKQYGFLIEQRVRHPDVVVQAVEDRASGIGLLQEGRSRGTPFKPLKADGDKVRRAMLIATAYENGQVYHRAAAEAAWLDDFETELMFFPNAKNDDQTDCLAYAGIMALRKSMGKLQGPLIFNNAEQQERGSGDTPIHTGADKMKEWVEQQKKQRRATADEW